MAAQKGSALMKIGNSASPEKFLQQLLVAVQQLYQ